MSEPNGDAPAPLLPRSLDERRAEFEEWVRTVRDPANAHSEGARRVTTKGAIAEYEVAEIANGFAVRLCAAYETGTMASCSVPWTRFATREECVARFLSFAREHFSRDFRGITVPDSQRRARTAMQSLLDGEGLFGFLEPDPVPAE